MVVATQLLQRLNSRVSKNGSARVVYLITHDNEACHQLIAKVASPVIAARPEPVPRYTNRRHGHQNRQKTACVAAN
jgi:hypothetical protein